MAEPSSTVHGVLLPHVHLVVQQQFPHQPGQIHLNSAFDLLLQAPQTVRNRPVAWQYWQLAPRDGSMFLVWQPTNQLGTTFASDGLLWSGPEVVLQRDVREHIVQIFVAESGFIVGQEQVTLHRRTRYRIISSPNGAHDPSLELVHYTPAAQDHHIPVRAIQLTPQMQKSLTERAFLEKQGSLPNNQFMLHDRMNYPTITVPGPIAPAYPQAGMQRPVVQRPPAAQATRAPGPSPSKRAAANARPAGPINPFTPQQPVSAALVDEDNHYFGDALDFLTPREISAARFKQHHEWMEEILSSPYALSQITPVKLGPRMEGELDQLESLLKDGKVHATEEMTPEKLDELEARVREFEKRSQDELAAMRKEHKDRMEEIGQQKLFSNLERRLTEKPDAAGVASVTAEAEASTGLAVTVKEHVRQVQKGGILERGTENLYNNGTEQQNTTAAPNTTTAGTDGDAIDEFADFTNMDTAGEALADLDFYDTMYQG